jgi:hypothetical protein
MNLNKLYRLLPAVCVGWLAAGLATTQAGETLSGDSPALTQSLAGEWRFGLDPKNEGAAAGWFNQTLPDTIELPGSCEQRGFGVKPEKPEVRRLTHVLKYVGPAWYQREIVIPENWSGKRVELFLERCHWETTVWVDGVKMDMQNSLCAPHRHDLGRLSPGKHTLTICEDNTYKIHIGDWAHAITEDTQGNWNGIIGRIELTATDPVWVRDVQVFLAKLRVNVGNQTGEPVTAEIQSRKFDIPAGGAEVELPFAAKDKPWDEFTPQVRHLAVTLQAGAFQDTRVVAYALRDFATTNKQFILNGRPVLLRGTVDECVYPLTGYPPMDKAEWLRVLRICQSYGFNYMRFHSWCPPEAAFAAADELGFLFQIELPFWTIGAPQFGQDEARDQYLRDELDRILTTYGNHPSFGFMAMGNESGGSLDTLVRAGRARDPRHLYRCENGNDAAHGDYVENGQRGFVGPRTDWDRWQMTPGWIAGAQTASHPNQPDVPMFAHEVGQWEMYPRLDEVTKYTGTLRALTFDRYRESLAAHHMLDEADDFAVASGKLSVELYKDEIEGCFRTWPYGGFQILEARDYPGQGVAIVGWLDAFWDSKGLITPEQFRRFCGPTVCLLRMPARVYTTADVFDAQAEISHYGPKALAVKPDWSIADEAGGVIAEGKFPAAKLATGRVTALGEIHAALAAVAAPARLVVTLRAGGTSNSWSIWVYPTTTMTTAIPDGVSVVHEYNQATRDLLAAGRSVVLLSSPTEGVIHPIHTIYGPESLRKFPAVQPGTNAIPGSFMPTFWNLQLFNQIGTLGILCDPKSPALAEFPTGNHSDWQWADLLGNFSAANSFPAAGAPESYGEKLKRSAGDVDNRSKAFILDETPADYRPILQVIDNQERNAKLGSIFETRVGPGKLLVCGLDLDTDLAKRPAALQLRKSLLDYAAGEKFQPKFELSGDLLERLLTGAR